MDAVKNCTTCVHNPGPTEFCARECGVGWTGWEGVEAPGYPDDNPKTAIGTKKPPVSVVPPVAVFHLGQAMKDGKEKYGLMNWREKRVSSSVYFDAAMRHLMSWWDGEDRASDSGVHHLAHAMACMAILLDAESIGKLNDDRPLPGNLPAFITANTKEQS